MANKNIDIKYVKNLKKGDIESFDEIYKFYKESMYFFILSLVKNKADAEDVLQETFIKILRDISTLKKNSSFTSWIYTIAYSLSINNLNKSKDATLSETNEYLLEEIVEKDEPSDIFNKKDVVDIVRCEIEKLPIKFIQVAQLHFLNELSVREISKILSVPERTVRDRIARIKKVMKESLTNSEYTPKRYFSFAGIPLLFLVMQSIVDRNKMSTTASEEIHDNVTSKSKTSFSKTSPTKLSTIIAGAISTKILIAMFAVLAVFAVGVFLNTQSKQDNQLVDASMEKKYFSNMTYLDSIYYNRSLTRESVDVTVDLLETVHAKDVQVIQAGENIPFEIKDNTILFNANKNGEFKVRVFEEQTKINISNIDKHAPKIASVDYLKQHIKIHVLDEDSRFDFSKSYALFNGEKYQVTNDGKVLGNLNGDIKLYMFDRLGEISEYTIEH